MATNVPPMWHGSIPGSGFPGTSISCCVQHPRDWPCTICSPPTPEPHLAAAYGEMNQMWDNLRRDLEAIAMTPQSPPERFERATWDVPISFTARLGGRTP